MKILIISHYFPPKSSIAALRPYSWAKFWSRAGHEVVVLTTPAQYMAVQDTPLQQDTFVVQEIGFPLYDRLLQMIRRKAPQGKEEYATSYAVTKKQRGGRRLLNQVLTSLNAFRRKRGVSSTARMPDMLDFWISPALRWAEGQHWDLVVSSHGPYACHMIAMGLKKKRHANFWIADFRDPWVDNHIYKGLFPFTWFERNLERRVAQHADAIVTVSDPIADLFRAKYPSQAVYTVENGFDRDDLNCLPPELVFPTDGKVRIVYTGSVYIGKQDPSPLFAAIASLAQEGENHLLDHLEVIFIGANGKLVTQIASEMGVDKWVKHYGFVPRQTALCMQRDAHALLFLEFESKSLGGILSGKVFEYLSSGTEIWVVGTGHEGPSKLIGQLHAGEVFNKDVNAIKSALRALLTDGRPRKVFIPEAIIKRFDREGLALRMLEFASVNKEHAS